VFRVLRKKLQNATVVFSQKFPKEGKYNTFWLFPLI